MLVKVLLVSLCLLVSGCATEYYNFKRNPDSGELECVQYIKTKGTQHTITKQNEVDVDNNQESFFKDMVNINGVTNR